MGNSGALGSVQLECASFSPSFTLQQQAKFGEIQKHIRASVLKELDVNDMIGDLKLEMELAEEQVSGLRYVHIRYAAM